MAYVISRENNGANGVNIANGMVTPINLATGKTAPEIKIDGAEAVTVDPTGTTVYVSSAKNSIVPIPVATNTPGRAITDQFGPSGMAISQNGTLGYVLDGGEVHVTVGAPSGFDTITPVLLATGALGTPIPVRASPVAIALTPDGSHAYVVTNCNAYDGGTDGAPGSVVPITLS